MNLSILTKKVLINLKEEVAKDDNITMIKKDILKPLIKHTIDELYPYFLKMLFIIIIILFYRLIFHHYIYRIQINLGSYVAANKKIMAY